MYQNWKINILGLNPTVKGVSLIEIEESKIIGNSDKNIWIFWMIDCFYKEARIYLVMEDKTLFSLVKNNVYTINDNL